VPLRVLRKRTCRMSLSDRARQTSCASSTGMSSFKVKLMNIAVQDAAAVCGTHLPGLTSSRASRCWPGAYALSLARGQFGDILIGVFRGLQVSSSSNVLGDEGQRQREALNLMQGPTGVQITRVSKLGDSLLCLQAVTVLVNLVGIRESRHK
jgi:hypothetical protein